MSPPAAFQLCVSHRSRGDKVIGKNQELLTYTRGKAGKNPWIEPTTNKSSKPFCEPARGWPPGHLGFLECLKDQKERKERKFVDFT